MTLGQAGGASLSIAWWQGRKGEGGGEVKGVCKARKVGQARLGIGLTADALALPRPAPLSPYSLVTIPKEESLEDRLRWKTTCGARGPGLSQGLGLILPSTLCLPSRGDPRGLRPCPRGAGRMLRQVGRCWREGLSAPKPLTWPRGRRCRCPRCFRRQTALPVGVSGPAAQQNKPATDSFTLSRST